MLPGARRRRGGRRLDRRPVPNGDELTGRSATDDGTRRLELRTSVDLADTGGVVGAIALRTPSRLGDRKGSGRGSGLVGWSVLDLVSLLGPCRWWSEVFGARERVKMELHGSDPKADRSLLPLAGSAGLQLPVEAAPEAEACKGLRSFPAGRLGAPAGQSADDAHRSQRIVPPVCELRRLPLRSRALRAGRRRQRLQRPRHGGRLRCVPQRRREPTSRLHAGPADGSTPYL